MEKVNIRTATKPKPKGKRSPEFVKWVWLDDIGNNGFCGGIYFHPSNSYYSSILSDLYNLTFDTEHEAAEWLLANKRGEHATKTN